MSVINKGAPATAISIDAVLSRLQHWRENKSSYPNTGIPDDIWQMIFSLENAGHRPSTLRSLFSLNSQQFLKKREQLKLKPVAPSREVGQAKVKANESLLSSAQFSEVAVTTSTTEIPPLTSAAIRTQQAKQLRSPDQSPSQYLDMATIIVECIRPDGHRLKIHTTHHRLDVIMNAFFAQEDPSC